MYQIVEDRPCHYLLPFHASVARLFSIWVDFNADLEENRFVEIVMADYRRCGSVGLRAPRSFGNLSKALRPELGPE